MRPPLNSADDERATRGGPAGEAARRLTALEVRVDDLLRARRRARVGGPILLLALAAVTPLAVVHSRTGPDASFTLVEVALGRVGGLPAGLFVALGALGLLGVTAAAALGRSTGNASTVRWVVALGVALLVLLLAALLVAAAAARPGSTVQLLTPALVLGGAAAIGLIGGALELRR